MPVAEVLVGDRLVVQARASAFRWTARCWKADTQVDESMLTGEPLPVAKERGARS